MQGSWPASTQAELLKFKDWVPTNTVWEDLWQFILIVVLSPNSTSSTLWVHNVMISPWSLANPNSKYLSGWIPITIPQISAPFTPWGNTLPCAVWGQSTSEVFCPIFLGMGSWENATQLSPFGFPWGTCQNHNCILICYSSGFFIIAVGVGVESPCATCVSGRRGCCWVTNCSKKGNGKLTDFPQFISHQRFKCQGALLGAGSFSCTMHDYRL